MPHLHIITGSNGAGKSTVGPDYLPLHIQEQGNIFNGDKLFMEKRSEFWNSGIKSHKECKKLAIEFVNETFENLEKLNQHFPIFDSVQIVDTSETEHKRCRILV